MTEETKSTGNERPRKVIQRGGGDAVYGLGLIGALVYYLGHAATFWIGVVGVLKAIVWPAFLVFELMKYLGM